MTLPNLTRVFAAISMLYLAGCVTSAETKIASTQYKSAINAYAQDVRAFEDAWLEEIDLLVADFEDALMANVITAKIRNLSAQGEGFAGDEWESAFEKSGLITLSAEIDSERDRVHSALRFLYSIDIPAGDDPEAIIDEVLSDYRNRMIAAIRVRPGWTEEQKDAFIAEQELGPFGANEDANDLVSLIIQWRINRRDVDARMKNLHTVVAALKKAHASVDRWIQTDVSAPGDELADLVITWSDQVGGTQ